MKQSQDKTAFESNTPTFVYLNPYLGFYLNKAPLKEFLNEKFNTSNWRGYQNDLTDIQKFFRGEDIDEVSVLCGVSMSQFMEANSGGITVNPAVFGLVMDTNRWNKIMQENKTKATIRYISMSYDFYKSLAGRQAVTKEEYNLQGNFMVRILEDLPGFIKETLH